MSFGRAGSKGPVELTLSWRDGLWHAVGDDIDLTHQDLASLDGLIVTALSTRQQATRAVVRFDTSRLPVWLRQYQSHYFNYMLSVDGGERQ